MTHPSIMMRVVAARKAEAFLAWLEAQPEDDYRGVNREILFQSWKDFIAALNAEIAEIVSMIDAPEKP